MTIGCGDELAAKKLCWQQVGKDDGEEEGVEEEENGVICGEVTRLRQGDDGERA